MSKKDPVNLVSSRPMLLGTAAAFLDAAAALIGGAGYHSDADDVLLRAERARELATMLARSEIRRNGRPKKS